MAGSKNQSQTFGQRLQWALDRFGGTKADMARLCGVTPAAVTGWYSGAVKDLSAENLFAIARSTGVDAEWLGTGRGSPGTSSRTALPADSDVALYMAKLSPSTKAHVRALLRELAEAK